MHTHAPSCAPALAARADAKRTRACAHAPPQRAAEDSTEKRTKDTYGPPMGKRLIMFIDDLNMPRLDKYGTQQPIAFLKLFIERRGMYDRGKDLSWKNMKDVQVGGGQGRCARRAGKMCKEGREDVGRCARRAGKM